MRLSIRSPKKEMKFPIRENPKRGLALSVLWATRVVILVDRSALSIRSDSAVRILQSATVNLVIAVHE
jgi:hypothetical protein